MKLSSFISLCLCIHFLSVKENLYCQNINPFDQGNLQKFTVDSIHNYINNKEEEEKTLQLYIDTSRNDKDSLVLTYRKTNNKIFKLVEKCFYKGFVINVTEKNDSFFFSHLINDTIVNIETKSTYYSSIGKIEFSQRNNYNRGSAYDSPCEGCVTVHLTNRPTEYYYREKYNHSGQLIRSVFFSYTNEDWSYKRVTYSYDTTGQICDTKSKVINFSEFWID